MTCFLVKNYKVGLDAPQNRINRLADSISFRARQNQLNSIKNKLFDMNSLLTRTGDNVTKKDYQTNEGRIKNSKFTTINNLDFAGTTISKKYVSER